jgi:hypothetical protein
MTNREAIAAEIQPYSLDEDGLEKLFIDSASHFGVEADVDDDYVVATMQRPVALAAMRCLARMKVLSSEKIDVIQNNYDTKKLDQAIASIAASAGLSPSLVESEDDNYKLTAVDIW